MGTLRVTVPSVYRVISHFPGSLGVADEYPFVNGIC